MILGTSRARRSVARLVPVAGLLLSLLLAPRAAAIPDLFVSSSLTHSVKRFDGETGAFLGNFILRRAGGLDNTQECIFGPDGHAYVVGFGNNAVLKFHGATGESLGAFSSGFLLSGPTKATYGPDGDLYVSQWGGTRRVVRFDAITGAFQGQATNVPVTNGMGQAWDADGNLYLAFWGNDGTDGGVLRFDPAGNLLGSFVAPGFLLGPVNLWFDGAGDLLVQDWTQGSFERFDGSTGAWKSTFVTGLTRTEGWTWGPDGKLYACDWQLNTVNRYEADGSFDVVFASGANMSNPNDVTFGPEHPVSAPTPRPVALGDASSHAFPNPFRDETSIRFTLARAGRVELDVLDVRGRRVASLVRGELPPGDHSVRWDGGARAGGVYFYRLRTGNDDVRTGRIVRLR